MKFFWPDPLDLIDPGFNFLLERARFGVARHQCQKYPHEVFPSLPYHGFVVSKIHVDGNARWNASQVNRFYREGAKRFLRLPPACQLMGDSGAYTRTFLEEEKKHLADECLEVISFYDGAGVDYGPAPDQVISGYREGKEFSEKEEQVLLGWQSRWTRTLELAETFLALWKKKASRWKPMGVAQGWDCQSYQKSVRNLEQIGYDYIALGGLNRLKKEEILRVVKACHKVRAGSTVFHLLGVSRLEYMELFSQCGVVSFDSSMPVRQAVKDDRHNYHFFEKDYLAVRVPQSSDSPKLNRLIKTRKLNYKELKKIERLTMDALRRYDSAEIEVEEVLEVLERGINYRAERDFLPQYRELLKDKPWQKCSCSICKETGIEVVLLRNRERNLRRGFHNLFVFSTKLKTLFPSFRSES